MEIRPIAGTRRRGRTPEEDLALEKELLADPKERAEHVMLIDLGRNDVGRVAATGSVLSAPNAPRSNIRRMNATRPTQRPPSTGGAMASTHRSARRISRSASLTSLSVSEPRREYLWVLSRTPKVAPEAYAALLERLHARGFDTAKLEVTRQEAP